MKSTYHIRETGDTDHMSITAPSLEDAVVNYLCEQGFGFKDEIPDLEIRVEGSKQFRVYACYTIMRVYELDESDPDHPNK
jgi:hypothetical protein